MEQGYPEPLPPLPAAIHIRDEHLRRAVEAERIRRGMGTLTGCARLLIVERLAMLEPFSPPDQSGAVVAPG